MVVTVTDYSLVVLQLQNKSIENKDAKNDQDAHAKALNII